MPDACHDHVVILARAYLRLVSRSRIPPPFRDLAICGDSAQSRRNRLDIVPEQIAVQHLSERIDPRPREES